MTLSFGRHYVSGLHPHEDVQACAMWDGCMQAHAADRAIAEERQRGAAKQEAQNQEVSSPALSPQAHCCPEH